MRIETSLFILAFLIFSCNEHQTNEPASDRLVSNFRTSNSIHLKGPMIGMNKIETFGELGMGFSENFRDSVDHWDRKTPELSERTAFFDIWVDTANTVPLEVVVHELGYPTYDTLSFSIDSTYNMYDTEWANFAGLPVYITNRDSIGHILEFQDGSIYMIYEAQDSTGTWKPIENWGYTHFCGNSYYELVIKPSSYMITKVLKYEGDYETNLRLKFRNFDRVTYSNTFRGRINYEQFNDSTFVAFSKIMAEQLYWKKTDSLDFYANEYLAAMRLEKSM